MMSFFKGVSSLLVLCSAEKVDALLDDVAGLDDVLLVSESELSSDESVIAYAAARTRSSSLISSLVRSVFSNLSFALFIIVIIFVLLNPIFLAG